MSRPTKYKPEYAEQAKGLAALGAVDTDLASFFKVDISTIYRWKVKFPDFCEALNEYKAKANDLVERSLFERAIGYSCPETKVFMTEGGPVEVNVMKRYPPDTTAQIFWLKNRKPDEWRANPEGEKGSGNDLSEAVNKLIDKLPD